MPIGAILETGGAGRFLCVHGGISPNVTSLDQFERFDRFAEPGMNGFLCDVLWADPIKVRAPRFVNRFTLVMEVKT